MKLNGDARALLGRARIGMLALNATRMPLVTPAAFHFGNSSLLMTTSRHAVKVALARRDPRAAFLVEDSTLSVLLQGLLEVFDPRSLEGPVRAFLEGPRFALGVAGYALKNAPFVAGYMLDLASIPGEWWPQNRVLLRLRVTHRKELPALEVPAAAPARLPAIPAAIARPLARSRAGRLCWSGAGSPQLAPVPWALDGSDALVWLPAGAGRPPREGAPAALLVESHHPFRATRMLGACLRGHLRAEPGNPDAIEERYGEPPADDGLLLRLVSERATWWRGFQVRTVPVGVRVGSN
jgi:nitroimidazol reductase NimA-like FMN-containing flavoprotein (pyridoxamine 5'-phosphate oxidase superfamily)